MRAGLCGFSMGGVHAGMTAALFPGPLAVVPLLAPRSASAAFVHGALREATAWRPLAEPVDEARRVRGPATVAEYRLALEQYAVESSCALHSDWRCCCLCCAHVQHVCAKWPLKWLLPDPPN